MCSYNPKIDLVFRKLFGSEENVDLLLSFLNAILEKEMKLERLEIKNPYNFATYVTGKTSILDIKAVDEQGIWYDIEMQIAEQGFYGKRALYYWGKVYTDQVEKAESFAKLKKTIGIHLLDFNYFQDERYLRRVVLKDFDSNQIYFELDYEELYFIEMSKFQKGYQELKTVLDRWLVFMNKAYELNRNNLPVELRQEQEISKAVEKLEIMHFTEQERELYEAERKFRMNHQEETRTAEEKGIIKGEKRASRKIAQEMLHKGIQLELIAEVTGLTLEELVNMK